MDTVKVPKLIEDSIVKGEDGVSRRVFAFAEVNQDGGFRSALGPEWLDQPDAVQRIEMAEQYRNAVLARNPPPPTPEEMQNRLIDLTRDLLVKQAELIALQQDMLAQGIPPDLSIVLASPDQPPLDDPLPLE